MTDTTAFDDYVRERLAALGFTVSDAAAHVEGAMAVDVVRLEGRSGVGSPGADDG